MTAALRIGSRAFSKVLFIDFEYSAPPGERPRPHCVAVRDFETGDVTCTWLADNPPPEAPYPTDKDTLFVAYHASADIGCHCALGWSLPTFVIDPCAEHKLSVNGLGVRGSLLDALRTRGLQFMDAGEKTDMRALAIRGAPFTDEERAALLGYNREDVDALDRLFRAMLPQLDDHALLRGLYSKAVAVMEHTGVPVDTALLADLRAHWEELKLELVACVSETFPVFDGTTFKHNRFADWLVARNIAWPLLDGGRLKLDTETMKLMADRYPTLRPLYELRTLLSKFRLNDFAVGSDGRNRAMISQFGAKSGRNTPGASKFVFGPARFLRAVIKPIPGWAVAYLDWEQQEFGIAAALSGDRAMLEAYASGDPYLAFAKQAGLIPPSGTRESHPNEREACKTCVLGVQYGMGVETLAARIGCDVATASNLLYLHRRTYPQFWRWNQGAINFALLNNSITASFGWTLHVVDRPDRPLNTRTFGNFPMQANGAEMLRVACIKIAEARVRLCAPVHDAVLIEATAADIDNAVAITRRAMSDASAAVLAGFRLGTEAKIVRYPGRYMDPKGAAMWNLVQASLVKLHR